MRTRPARPPKGLRKLPPPLCAELLRLAAAGAATPAQHAAVADALDREPSLRFAEWAELRRFLDRLVPRAAEAAGLGTLARRAA